MPCMAKYRITQQAGAQQVAKQNIGWQHLFLLLCLPSFTAI